MKTYRFYFVLLLVLVGCSKPTTDVATLHAIASDADKVLRIPHEPNMPVWYFEVPKADWPTAIAGLEPKSVGVRREGVYIVMSTFFVSERGYFVPRNSKTFRPKNGTDPHYEAIGQGVFWYRIEG